MDLRKVNIMKKLTNEQLQQALRERQGKIERLELELSNAYASQEREYLRGYKDMADKTFNLMSTAFTWLLMKCTDETDQIILRDILEKGINNAD